MIALYILLVHGWIFKPVTTHDLGKGLPCHWNINIGISTSRKKLLKKFTLWQNIIWAKVEKKAAINVISPGFDNLCNAILQEVVQKLLKEMQQIYINIEIEFNEDLQSKYPKIYVRC